MAQHEIARLLGVHEGHLSKILSGRQGPSLELALKLEDLTQIPPRAWRST